MSLAAVSISKIRLRYLEPIKWSEALSKHELMSKCVSTNDAMQHHNILFIMIFIFFINHSMWPSDVDMGCRGGIFSKFTYWLCNLTAYSLNNGWCTRKPPVAHKRHEYVHCLRSNGEIPLECSAIKQMDKLNIPAPTSRGDFSACCNCIRIIVPLVW